ncbi:MAG TPA: hypothetical protein VNI54_03795 [Thermoanaerobaculia bacterium]|nr:hypothetical protein [Thermoanaerobaculia bacterium]
MILGRESAIFGRKLEISVAEQRTAICESAINDREFEVFVRRFVVFGRESGVVARDPAFDGNDLPGDNDEVEIFKGEQIGDELHTIVLGRVVDESAEEGKVGNVRPASQYASSIVVEKRSSRVCGWSSRSS